MRESVKKAIKKYEQTNSRLTVRLDGQVLNKFNEYCEQTGCTKKSVIEAAIMEYIDKH